MTLGEYERFRDAISTIESDDNPDITGDGGRAYGRWQMHPAWVIRYQVEPRVDDTWNSYLERCLKRFFFARRFDLHRDRTIAMQEIAMEYHVGHPITSHAPGWDFDYALKFLAALKPEAQQKDSV